MLKPSRRTALPGFGLTMGMTLLWLGLIVLIPLSGVFLRAADASWGEFAAKAFSDRALAAYRLSFGGALMVSNQPEAYSYPSSNPSWRCRSRVSWSEPVRAVSAMK